MFRLTSKPVALITLFVFCATTFALPGAARAGWRDRSDELPGMDKGGSMTPYYIAGAAAVAALAVILIVKHNKKSHEATSWNAQGRELAPRGYALGSPGSMILGRTTGQGSVTALTSPDPVPFAGALRPLAVAPAAPVVTLAQLDVTNGGRVRR
jgi:hypothetical protein